MIFLNVLMAVMLLMICACSTPAQRFSSHAMELGFKEDSVESDDFRHQLFYKKNKANNVLHVYLDGDGTPWEHGRWVATDPTSRKPLILDMMALDTVSVVMLGRPCYHQLEQQNQCDNKLWTSHRYSARVVYSMVQALQRWLEDKHVERIVLIGYSGGGALAMLMAPHIRQLDQVVTLAANLDVAAWNDYHGFPPFKDSLNPVDYLPLVQNIPQLHLAGAEDSVVPQAIIQQFSKRVRVARFREYPGFDHGCCWQTIWPDVLAELGGL
jgi:dienelactone hydrolase